MTWVYELSAPALSATRRCNCEMRLAEMLPVGSGLPEAPLTMARWT